MQLLISGGRSRNNSQQMEEWHRSEAAIVTLIDTDTGTGEVVIEYQSPPDVCPNETPSVLFKSGALHEDRLYACTQTEVIVYQLPNFEIVNYISLPFFNDLHHVTPDGQGGLLVTVTGLDMVVRLDMDGNIMDEWSVLPDVELWSRFSRKIDYRKIATTKPHAAHPNYTFLNKNDVWTTRLEQKDAICLTSEKPSMKIDVERPHDGILYDEGVYFTTIDGHVVCCDLDTGEKLRTINLSEIFDANRPLGWCRGLLPVGNDCFIIGFTRLRSTKYKENVKWVKDQIKKNILRKKYNPSWALPSRISCVDLTNRKIVWEIDLEQFNMNEVFSIYRLN